MTIQWPKLGDDQLNRECEELSFRLMGTIRTKRTRAGRSASSHFRTDRFETRGWGYRHVNHRLPVIYLNVFYCSSFAQPFALSSNHLIVSLAIGKSKS